MNTDARRRKLTTIIYADVADYSRLTDADEEGTHRRGIARGTARIVRVRGYFSRCCGWQVAEASCQGININLAQPGDIGHCMNIRFDECLADNGIMIAYFGALAPQAGAHPAAQYFVFVTLHGEISWQFYVIVRDKILSP